MVGDATGGEPSGAAGIVGAQGSSSELRPSMYNRCVAELATLTLRRSALLAAELATTWSSSELTHNTTESSGVSSAFTAARSPCIASASSGVRHLFSPAFRFAV